MSKSAWTQGTYNSFGPHHQGFYDRKVLLLLKVTSPINELVIRDKSNQISLSKVISAQEIGNQFYDDLL